MNGGSGMIWPLPGRMASSSTYTIRTANDYLQNICTPWTNVDAIFGFSMLGLL
jgi:hypothetical protein